MSKMAVVLLILPLMLTSCSVERSQAAALAKQQLIGKSKEQILGCMGVPGNKQKEGNSEVWSYNSGGGTDSFASGYSQGQVTAYGAGNTAYAHGNESSIVSGVFHARYCVVNIVFNDTEVSAVNYSGRTGGLITQGEQCFYAVSNCVSSTPK